MPKVAPIDQRKADHIKINLEKDVRSTLTTGLENYHFVHDALPELDLKRVDPSLSLFGKRFAAPILICSMSGGTEGDRQIIPRRGASDLGVRADLSVAHHRIVHAQGQERVT